MQLKGQPVVDEDRDKVYGGVGYSFGPMYVGVGYPGQDLGMERREYFGHGASWGMTDKLCVPDTYQIIGYEVSPGRDSLDVADTYCFGPGYTLAGGFFAYDAGRDTSGPHQRGHNPTLVEALTDDVKAFA